jgi:hypothetical protein
MHLPAEKDNLDSRHWIYAHGDKIGDRPVHTFAFTRPPERRKRPGNPAFVQPSVWKRLAAATAAPAILGSVARVVVWPGVIGVLRGAERRGIGDRGNADRQAQYHDRGPDQDFHRISPFSVSGGEARFDGTQLVLSPEKIIRIFGIGFMREATK